MKKLTPRQSEVLAMIRDAIMDSGMPPTRAEIAEHFGFQSPNAAEQHLRALEKKGYLHIQSGASRGIILDHNSGVYTDMEVSTAGNDSEMELPLIGQVAAGSPILAAENIEDVIKVDKFLFQPSADYLLRVKGMSMKDVGIMDGDLIAIHRTPEVRNGQIVVARIEDEVTVKRFYQKDNKVLLLPENKTFDPIQIDLRTDELVIEGLAVGIIRRGNLH